MSGAYARGAERHEQHGTAILLVEQNALAALEIADYAYVLENGRVVFDGTPERVHEHEDIREFYLGGRGIHRSQAVQAPTAVVGMTAGIDTVVTGGRPLEVATSTLRFGGVLALIRRQPARATRSTVGIIGPNGAGKTSLLNCLNGFYQPQSGYGHLRRHAAC